MRAYKCHYIYICSMIHAHSEKKQQSMRTIKLPRNNNWMFIQGKLQNHVGFNGNPLESDAKPENMPEGGVESE